MELDTLFILLVSWNKTLFKSHFPYRIQPLKQVFLLTFCWMFLAVCSSKECIFPF